MSYKIKLKKGKDFPLRKFHPWVYSGAVMAGAEGIEPGTIVEVYSYDNNFLATGYWNDGGIAVKILSFRKDQIDQDFWNEKIYNAVQYRIKTGLCCDAGTNAYRLVNAEGDGMPGLIADKYAGSIVIQIQSLALEKYIGQILSALKAVNPEVNTCILRSSLKSELLLGDSGSAEILENNLKFRVNLLEGQKTGFFLDQRENRKLIQPYVNNKTILNTFCYSGGFSLSALRAGAAKVLSIDSSKEAMDMLAENLKLNNFSQNHESLTTDVFDYFNQSDQKFDVIILDPPAFCKHRNAVDNAVKAYSSLNQQAMQRLTKGGLLFTFSCSQLVGKQSFRDAVSLAASRAGRHFKIVRELQAAACHPVSLSHPEGEYLKGFLLAEA